MTEREMTVQATTTRRGRVVGSLVAAAVAAGAMGMIAVPAQATGPGTYTSEAQKAAGYIDSHSGDLTNSDLGPQLDGALALIAAGKTDSPTLAKVKQDIKTKGPTYCTVKNVGGCAKVTITLLAAGESTTYGGFDYADKVTSAFIPAPDGSSDSVPALKEYPTNQALDMIALERLGKPIPQGLFKSVTEYAASTPQWADPDTDGLMLTALSYVKGQDAAKSKAVDSLVKRLDAAKVGDAWTPSGEGNVNTTAWVAAGLYRAGDAGHKDQAVKGQAWLLTKQNKQDGSFPGAVVTPAGTMLATVQVVPALLGLQSYDNVGANPAQEVAVS